VLIIVRHGRTIANAAGLLQGRVDHPLDEVGEQQAQRIASALGAVDRVISSPLVRARETAAALGRPVEIDDRWLELDYGEFDGRAMRDVPIELWRQWLADADFAPPGGESYGNLTARVGEACAELLADAQDRMIVVVSHVSPIKAAVAWALGVPATVAFRCHLDQASICRIDVGRFGPMLRSYNEVWHLADTGPDAREVGVGERANSPTPTAAQLLHGWSSPASGE
jgi:broad specificity phosphatase PhoE